MSLPRRSFIRQSGLAAGAVSMAPVPSLSFPAAGLSGRDAILEKLTALNDETIKDLLEQQVNRPGDRWDGGVLNEYDVVNTHSTAWFIIRIANSYASGFSWYYLNEDLVPPLKKASECLLNVQHKDGTIDLHSTNFHSTPDTAFIINYISPVYIVLEQLRKPELAPLLDNLGLFVRNAGKCLTVGGIHTPNHRWVVCSALARLNQFYPDQKYIDRIDEWLAEGIDQDPDGQYTEQSVSIYSPTCDNMFITMARLLDRKELFDVVRKNLDMSLYYIQPGGEVLTDASNRQDNARTGYVDRYYYAYRYFAIMDKNPKYAAVCKLIETQRPQNLTRYIGDLMEDPVFEKKPPAPIPIPDDYFKRFIHSGVFRIRRGQMDLSVIEGNPTFLNFMKGSAVLQSLRLSSAFFGTRGQFISENTEVRNEKIILSKSHTHGYYQPLPEEEITGDGDWDKMPRGLRSMSELQTMNYRVEISERDKKVRIDIQIEGTPYVPVSMELSFRKGGVLNGVKPDEHLENAHFLENGYGTYHSGEDIIRFGPGISNHKWAEIRGMLPKQPGLSVYLTGYTPFKHTIELS